MVETTPLVWDKVGERVYETGTSKGVLFPQLDTGLYGPGVAWNGLTSVKQSPDGAEVTDLFADNIKYLSLQSAENFKGNISAYTYPEEFAACDGSAMVAPGLYLGQQARRGFSLVYSTIVGNDVKKNAYGEKMHIIYGAAVAPSERSYETVNNDPSAITFSWDFTTTPATTTQPGMLPTAYLVVDSTKTTQEKFQALKDVIYGKLAVASKLPTIDEVIALVKE